MGALNQCLGDNFSTAKNAGIVHNPTAPNQAITEPRIMPNDGSDHIASKAYTETLAPPNIIGAATVVLVGLVKSIEQPYW